MNRRLIICICRSRFMSFRISFYWSFKILQILDFWCHENNLLWFLVLLAYFHMISSFPRSIALKHYKVIFYNFFWPHQIKGCSCIVQVISSWCLNFWSDMKQFKDMSVWTFRLLLSCLLMYQDRALVMQHHVGCGALFWQIKE